MVLGGVYMPDCCSSSPPKPINPVKHRCPVNGVEYAQVSSRTVFHHIKESWRWDDRGQSYFFCDDPACDVVYFGIDDTVIVSSQVRTLVGEKHTSEDAMLCYCYGATKADVLREKGIRDFVIEKTKQGDCSCETSNPSGSCCLKYFPPKNL